MARPDTHDRPGTAPGERTAPGRGRGLVVVGAEYDGAAPRGLRPGRVGADAAFLAHLLASAEPNLRPSRSERTRSAAARYAETARRA